MAEQENRPDASPSRPEPPLASSPHRSPRARLGALAGVVLVAALILAWWHPWRGMSPASDTPGASGSAARHGRNGPGSRFADMPQPVHVATAKLGDMPIVLTALGTVTPLATVTVKTQLSGTLQSVGFKEGQMVRQGDLLAQIDPRPYEISLANAQGTLAKDMALLQTARLDLERYRTLLAQDSIARQQVDTQASLVKQYEGQVKSDQANVDTYKLDLTYARITAPVTGRVGLRQVDPGNYVTPSDTNGIVVITQLQPISVVFTTSEDNLPAILKRMHTGVKLSTTAYDRNNTTSLETGYLETLDNQIDTSTGTVKLRALFENKEQLLFPNQFVNARLLVDTIRNAVIVPSSAVLNGSSGQFVYVAKPDNTVTVRLVKVGPVDGERTSIASGLAAGERVVVDGSDRLREGAKITIPADAASGASAAQAAQPGSRPEGGHRRAHASAASAASAAH
ncbi:MdtA/MuxA family multidrug efflux RND transporter periplasmic adaptor subunit [Trinickia caryophylli]|uniref:Membrane fusion protein, multidrug efflux system n=1 Tax=Trinickia caryophylli TaxID=28094 RepID=A0A1X7DXG5_TRICW|nr:MdtA/MuxA family multidrug efflux RND transporter periplasmic adaptor subunit [Trinickia caryophylli]PMS14308.1 multidrug transporter subunit MdtA [Trinickia caryophylli]TRX17868.1 MdtA/MuxA family multidrug efflux RND transporter periplasmic adaptor subunit [Trinickia caryophylli]WQE11362.1 MdtA/MuxA family multidrug efflux RND transporter periplasmic adaptor subunit [Trinickia caryophylli]SMF23609.1 membrane fusion protein, multidrug efflux system [Trinickia caryophylli]GLU32520.1 transpo